jgi:hypothetical protein
MSETYAPILPGNWVTHINSYALPNPDFAKNKRTTGDPRDRNQQGILFMPGWIAVRKVAYANITETAGKEFDLIVPSPDTRSSDKPRADIKGLLIPAGAIPYRLGLRVEPISAQPGYYSSGPLGAVPDMPKDAGLVGTADHGLALAEAVPAAAAAGAITATSATTSTLVAAGAGQNPLRFGADKRMLAGSVLTQTNFGDAPVVTTADLIIKLFSVDDTGAAAGDDVASDLLGGVNIVAEVCYLVKEAVAGLDEAHLPGMRYAGYTG